MVLAVEDMWIQEMLVGRCERKVEGKVGDFQLAQPYTAIHHEAALIDHGTCGVYHRGRSNTTQPRA